MDGLSDRFGTCHLERSRCHEWCVSQASPTEVCDDSDHPHYVALRDLSYIAIVCIYIDGHCKA